MWTTRIGEAGNRVRWAARALLVVGLVVLPALPVTAGDPGGTGPAIRVLLLTGANNHEWRATTPALRRILEDAGRFDVDVIDDPTTLAAERLAGADVILSNFNTFTTRTQPPRDPGWSAATRRAYTDFVRDGGGHVVVHAGSSSFYDWPAYQTLVISSFRIGQTDHGVRHAFPVRIESADHPITRGLTPFDTDVTVTTGADHAARIELDLTYHADDGPPALREHRRIDVSPPADDGRYHLDWTCVFVAERVVRLDRVPPPGEPGGRVYGGYAGLGMRLTRDLDERRIVSSDGPVTFEDDRHRSRARAVDYSGTVAGASMGVAIVDHPGNVNTPSPWYAVRSETMSYFGPAVLGEGPLTLAAGTRLTLRYRVLVHGDRWTADRLDAEHTRLVRETREQKHEEVRP